ncbi:MAG: EamA family transporter [Devosia sp.]
MSGERLPARDVGLIAVVVLIWASNFIVVRWGLDRMAPLALCAWRFALSFFPVCLFLPPPRGRWRLLVAFGVVTGLGQFGLLFVAMRDQISPAIAAVVVQTQAFFNIALAAIVLGERVRTAQVVGCIVAASGLVVIGMAAGASATTIGIVLTLLAGLSWACCNVMMRRASYDGDLAAFMVWMSPFAALPLAALSLVTEGPAALVQPIRVFDAATIGIVAWQAYANTIFGYAVWNRLIRTHGLARIAPLTLLVPVVAMGMAVMLLSEQLDLAEVAAAGLIIAGVVIPQWRTAKARTDAARQPVL